MSGNEVYKISYHPEGWSKAWLPGFTSSEKLYRKIVDLIESAVGSKQEFKVDDAKGAIGTWNEHVERTWNEEHGGVVERSDGAKISRHLKEALDAAGHPV